MVAPSQHSLPPSLSDFSSKSLSLAITASELAESPHDLPGTALQQAYQALKRLQALWKLDLARWELGWKQGALRPAYHRNLLPALMMELSVIEMTVRVWGTTLAMRDLRRRQSDATRVVRNVLNSQLQVRNQLLTLMLQSPSSVANEVSTAEQIRRRAERWTDLLISRALGSIPFFEFAYDPERLADFASEPVVTEDGSLRNSQQYLVETGLRLAFGQAAGQSPLTEPAFSRLWHAIETSSQVPQRELIWRLRSH